MAFAVIVDDQYTDRSLLGRLVESVADDVTVETFGDPRQALARLAQRQADLVITDYRMPQMNGVEFTRRFRNLPTGLGVPVVVITVVHDTEVRYRALEAGATDFLTKPIDYQECRARCRNLLTLSRQQQLIADHAESLKAARRRAMRALRTLSLCNDILVRTTDESTLLQEMCQLIVDEGGYGLAWVGYVGDEPDDPVRVAASATSDQGIQPSANMTWLTGVSSDGPIGTVARSGQPLVITDIAKDPACQPWGSKASAFGYLSAITLPLAAAGHRFGVLTIYSTERGGFHPDEVDLLTKTADTLAYGVMALRTNIEREQVKRDIAYLAYYDDLTGLPNRTQFLRRLETVLEDVGQNNGNAALLFIDLDRFKLVNDTSGHEAGDELLRHIVRRLKNAIREHDFLARHSGDEFAILIAPELGRPVGEDDGEAPSIADEAASVAERVSRVMEDPFVTRGYEYYIGTSIGISVFPDDATDTKLLLQQADTAMYRAKERGGGCYQFYSRELSDKKNRRLSLEARLRRAVDQGALVLHYQPIYDLNQDRMIGAEALVRWPQPSGALLMPEEFVPLAEETGLMAPIGEWVIGQASEQVCAWQQRGLPLYVAVNLSVHQLLRPDLCSKVMETVETTGVRPDRLELEITEGAMMTDPLRMERTVHELHGQGLRIAIDDFGTGFSSLSRLKRLPINTLKIDKSFIEGVPYDNDDMRIVTTIVQLAHNLDMHSVAEGIERDAQRQALRDLGCAYGQGHYFSEALMGNEVERTAAGGAKLPG